jgi:hypothetical protein
MRGSEHSHEFRTYEIGANGAVVGGPLRNYRGITTGVPEREAAPARTGHDGLTEREASVLDTLVRLGQASRDLLGERVGQAPQELKHTLARLVALGYVTLEDGAAGTYRAVAQAGGGA